MSLAEEIIAGKKSVTSMPPGAGGASKIDFSAPPAPAALGPYSAVHPAVAAQAAAASSDPAKRAPGVDYSIPTAERVGMGTRPVMAPTPAPVAVPIDRVAVNANIARDMSIPAEDKAAIGVQSIIPTPEARGMTPPVTAAAPVAPTPTPAPAPVPQGTAFTGTPGRGSVNPPMAITPEPTPEALPTAGAPAPTAAAPAPMAGTITIGGKTIQIPATGDLPAIPKVGATPGFIPGAAGGYVGGPIGGAPSGPVDSNGNGTTRTAELRAQLETQRADQAHDNDLNQASLAANQATAKEADAKRAAWEQEVADSSILNRPSAPYGTPAQMQAQVAMAQMAQQAKTARMQNQGMIRGQDIQARGQDVSAKTAEKSHEVQKRGQDVSAGVQTRGQDIQVQTTGMNNATSAANVKATNEAHMAVAKLQAMATSGRIQNLHVDPLTHMATYSMDGKVYSEPVPMGAMEPKKAK